MADFFSKLWLGLFIVYTFGASDEQASGGPG